MNHRPFSLYALFVLATALLAGCAGTTPAPTSASQKPVSPPVQQQICPPPLAQSCPVCQVCQACPVCPPAAPVAEPPPPPAEPLQRAAWSDLTGWTDDDHAQAWPALLESCKAIEKQARWKQVCEAARALGPQPSHTVTRQFFEDRFDPWVAVNPDGTRNGLITGYYEPLIKGSRNRSERFNWPIHAVPQDMLTIDFGDLYPELKSMRLRGRAVGNKVVPYWTRAELDRMQDRVPAATLLWAADPIDLFFLQVQGSGRVELPDGSHVRIGYADQNGHPYQSIGRWLVAQGELPLEKASMEGIKAWARNNPQRLAEMLNTNPSYVFFRELAAATGGPIGALGVPISEGRSIAIDPRTVPLGAPVFLSTTWPLSERPLRRLMLAQDTGGAIKGAVRADFFWGFGPDAGAQAGKMRQQGQVWVLLPKGNTP